MSFIQCQFLPYIYFYLSIYLFALPYPCVNKDNIPLAKVCFGGKENKQANPDVCFYFRSLLKKQFCKYW